MLLTTPNQLDSDEQSNSRIKPQSRKLWYVVKAKVRQEPVALEQLTRQNFDCFYPRIMARRKRNGRYVRIEEALFKNYLFIQLDVNMQNIAPIRFTRGVHGLVHFGGHLIPVPGSIIQAIMSRVDENDLLLNDATRFSRGQKVSLELGDFAGLEAIFDEPKGENRALLLINILGRWQRVDVPMNALASA